MLASQGRDLGAVALIMFLFGIGSALPLLIFGMLSREVLMRWRDRMMSVGKGLKATLGLILVVTGVAIVLGYDKILQTVLVNALARLANKPDNTALSLMFILHKNGL